MTTTLSDLLGVLLPNLSPALAGTKARSDLMEIAKNLPPIGRGVFECRLEDGSSQVDLIQSIAVGIEELSWLERHIAGNDKLASNPVWVRISDLSSMLTESFFNGVRAMWLEIDAVSLGSSPVIPSVYLRLNPEDSSHDRAYSAAEDALEILLGRPRPFPGLRSCWTSDNARIIHIGAMMARHEDDTLRVVFKPRHSEGILPFLQQIGWSGPSDEVEALTSWLHSFASHIDMLVQADVGPKASSRIGLECAWRAGPENDNINIALLDGLVKSCICSQEKRDGLLAWPGCTDPTSIQDPWPDQLIIESLQNPLNWFSLFERQVSTIKIIYQPGRRLKAKGYLWFEHHWFRPEAERLGGCGRP